MPRAILTKAKLVQPGWCFSLTVPVKVQSVPNLREHWAVKHRRVKRERTETALSLLCLPVDRSLLRVPLTITLTKLGGKNLDGDNLQGGFKGCRDEIAAWLRVDDGDERLTWVYRAEPGGPAGVRITLESVS